jgi:gluconate 5-dehydrogenase
VGELSGRVAVVTGASRGIGAACASALRDQGAHVIGVSRSPCEIEGVKSRIADLAQPKAAQEIATALLADFGCVDILVNCAGVTLNRRTGRLTVPDIEQVMALNAITPMVLAASLAAPMVDKGAGSIIGVSSISAVRGFPYQAAYAGSKGALDAYTRSLAAEWGPGGVRVNAVAPGLIITDMWAQAKTDAHVHEGYRSQISLRRWGTPEDIADVVCFLASDRSAYITGQVIAVDGGLQAAGYQYPWRSDRAQLGRSQNASAQ